MAEVETFTNPEELTKAVLEIRNSDFNQLLVCKLGGSIVRFASSVFPGEEETELYANTFTRNDSIGPHFDVYGDWLDEKFPWVGVYNLAGNAHVETTPLADDLAVIYRRMYPDRTDEASVARRHFGAIALGDPAIDATKFDLKPGIGMVFPQRPGGLEVVHEVTPKANSKPGKFLKIIRPKTDQSIRQSLTSEYEYKPLDVLMTEALGGESNATDVDVIPRLTELPHVPRMRRSRGRMSRRLD